MGTITEAYDLCRYGFAYVHEVVFPEVSLCIITMIATHLVFKLYFSFWS